MIKKIVPYLLVMALFALILNLTKPSYKYINTHDEDDNIVSGFLMSRNNLRFSSDIFSHHLPGAYLISEILDKSFKPQTTDQGVFVHRTFVTVWNYSWAILFMTVFGPLSLWLIVVIEMLRANYLYSLFQAENMILYPMTYLVLTLFLKKKIKPALTGLASGQIVVLLSPLWPLILISAAQFLYLNRHKTRNILVWVATLAVPIIWVAFQIDIKEFLIQFFGYNTLTYAPLLMKKPVLYTLAAFLAPGMVFFDLSFTTKTVVIQLLVLCLFVFGFKRNKVGTWILFGLLLGVIGFRGTPRFRNTALDFHILPWIVTLATLCWYKYFWGKFKVNFLWVLVLTLPAIFYFKNPSDYFPTKEQAGSMVIRYQDDSPVVNYLNTIKSNNDTLFTLPAHTLLYKQTGIKPFNKFLFYLPWMEKSPILYSELLNSFNDKLPTYVFIDSIHFPYTPPKEINDLLVNYQKVTIIDGEPPVYILKGK